MFIDSVHLSIGASKERVVTLTKLKRLATAEPPKGSSAAYKRGYLSTTGKRPKGNESLASQQSFYYENTDSLEIRLALVRAISAVSLQLSDRSLTETERETVVAEYPRNYDIRPEIVRYFGSGLIRKAIASSGNWFTFVILFADQQLILWKPYPIYTAPHWRETSSGIKLRTMQDYWLGEQSASAKSDEPASWVIQVSETITTHIKGFEGRSTSCLETLAQSPSKIW